MEINRRYLIGGGVAVVILAAVLVVVFGPGAEPQKASTPQGAFAAALDCVRAGDYDGVWGLLTERMRKTWGDGVTTQQAAAAEAMKGPNKEMTENMLRGQYGVGIDAFLAMSPRELYAAFLRKMPETVLSYQIAGPVKVAGERATMNVRARPDEPALEWTYVRQEDGRWLLDSAEAMKRK
jgi:hypothetical protein